MPKPKRFRRIGCRPDVTFFKPRGVRARDLKWVEIELDELEAMRLCYLEDLTQEEAGEKMGISRVTVSRILESASRKVAQALLSGQGIYLHSQQDPSAQKRFREE